MEMRRSYDEMGEIKKGPWKTEEDEVLIKHVKKCGARDWSSIRSKGLLKRTGKSCRLRWVNKLRPDLKNGGYRKFVGSTVVNCGLSGVKFSAEEERTVIELQGQYGNKWARIATYLPGRTDNDVKNFWSSRQKRLARVLQSSPPPEKSHKSHKVPIFEAPKSSSTDGESSVTSPKTLSCSSSYCEPSIQMVPMPDLVNPITTTSVATTEASGLLDQNNNQPMCQFEYTAIPIEENSCNRPLPPPLLQDFPLIALPPPPPFDTQDIFNQLGDPNFFAVFGPGGASDMDPFPYVPSGGEGESGGSCGKEESNDPMMMAPNTFIDDFPMDMFDHIEPLPSPSDW